MTHKINGSDACHSVVSQMELDLLAALLEPEDAAYPWNPTDDESETYFDELERQFAIQDVLDEELTTRAQVFYDKLDSLWSGVTNSSYYNCNTVLPVIDHLQENLHTAFAAGVPQGWLDAIATKAAEIFASQKSLGEQLVECVQSVLPTWAADDLSILARPYAYAMRSSEGQDLASVIDNVNNQDWINLSEVEQAKASVAIAYYAIRQLNDSQTES
ncbi:hypothetical protein [Anabaena subtropica]|uniref:Uncharacterized protein n=1 Tax=Anabaena subtropica FACHB-260 TaxID=2692884 RepID=A0ABR8CM30_9NOST|nr:hypothetical protein [Anabaena subtropica]MBD2343394.1 hypothetical protein [Anabaena subtropica FACHB-260]